MIFLITGASHTGKTWLAQRLLERYHIPYLSVDLLKMGLIRSGQTALSPEEDAALEPTSGPFCGRSFTQPWRTGSTSSSKGDTSLSLAGGFHPPRPGAHPLLLPGDEPNYLKTHFSHVKAYANVIEQRKDDTWFTLETALAENQQYLDGCRKYGLPYL